MKIKELICLIKESICIFCKAKEKSSYIRVYDDVFVDFETDLFYGVVIQRIPDGPRRSYYKYRITNYTNNSDIRSVYIRYGKRLSLVHIFKLLLKRRGRIVK